MDNTVKDILSQHVIGTLIVVILHMHAASVYAPRITIYDDMSNVYHTASYMFDHRLTRTITNNIESLYMSFPDHITHRYDPHTWSDTQEINRTLHRMYAAISQGMYDDIDTLAERIKDHEFDYVSGTGMLIVRLRDHPFVVKLFIASHDTLVRPYSWESFFFMRMNGGISRHIAGLTRLTTNQSLQQFFKQHRTSYPDVTVPRIWSWIPSDTSKLTVQLEEHGATYHASLPSVYAFVYDHIRYTENAHAPQSLVFDMFQDTDNMFDPHQGNCVIDTQTHEHVILDTEHFPTIVGFEKPLYTRSYPYWYVTMALQCLQYCLFPQLIRISLP